MSTLSDCYYWQAYSPESTNQYSLLMPFMNPALLIVSQPFLITLQAVKNNNNKFSLSFLFLLIPLFCERLLKTQVISVRGVCWFPLARLVLPTKCYVIFFRYMSSTERVCKNWLGRKFDKNRENFACNATRLASKNSTFSEYTKYNLSNITFLSHLLALLTLT